MLEGKVKFFLKNFAPPAGGRAAGDPSLRFGMTFSGEETRAARRT